MKTKVEIIIGAAKVFVCSSGVPSHALAEFYCEMDARKYCKTMGWEITGVYND